MSELISGKEAFDAAYNGGEAQWRWTGKDVEWRELKGETAFSINSLKDGVCEFRLKPRTITINGIEVPAPDHIEKNPNLYGGWAINIGSEYYMYKSESNYNIVVAALRSVFNPK